MKVEVWKCNGCGRLIEKRSEVYGISLHSLPFYVLGDPECEREMKKIELHFCGKCAKNLLNTLKVIAERMG